MLLPAATDIFIHIDVSHKFDSGFIYYCLLLNSMKICLIYKLLHSDAANVLPLLYSW